MLSDQPINSPKSPHKFSFRNYLLLFLCILVVVSIGSVFLHSYIASGRNANSQKQLNKQDDDEFLQHYHDVSYLQREQQYKDALKHQESLNEHLRQQLHRLRSQIAEKGSQEEASNGQLSSAESSQDRITLDECEWKISERLAELKPQLPPASPEATASSQQDHHRIGIVVFTYKRAQYLRRCLEALFRYKPHGGKFEIFVSQDGNDASVEQVVDQFQEVTLWQKDHNQLEKPKEGFLGNKAYYHIAQHYKFGLDQFFKHDSNFDRVIILEEDIEIAPDFYEYFESTGKLLNEDKTLFCVSAFNDNGMKPNVEDPMALYRSDFFPGLGWMMTREFWNEIKDKWPLGYWDDWLRLPENRRGRACIRPEISRTYTFGAEGVSKGQFFHQYLKNIHLTPTPINWDKVDLSYLKKENYDEWLKEQVKNAREISLRDKDSFSNQHLDLKLVYKSTHDFDTMTKAFKIMTDKKSGVPRGAYAGVVNFRHQRNQVFLVPNRDNILYSNNA